MSCQNKKLKNVVPRNSINEDESDELIDTTTNYTLDAAYTFFLFNPDAGWEDKRLKPFVKDYLKKKEIQFEMEMKISKKNRNNYQKVIKCVSDFNEVPKKVTIKA